MAIDTQTINEKLYVGSFLRSRAAQNLAERTLQQYGESVSQFAAYLVKMGMPTTPEAISREHVESFVTHLLARWKPLTAATRYRGLQQYFKWLVEEGEIKESPMAGMKPPRVPEQPPEVVSEDDIRRLFKACEGRGFEERRDMAIIRLLMDAGLRRPELAGPTLEDVDFGTNTVTVMGKGGRVRMVPFGRNAWAQPASHSIEEHHGTG